jgi:translation initiation factor IF-2
MKKTATKKETERKARPPIVAVLGHIDHGKTTLLDYIRKQNSAGSEAGGITQHVSAYETEYNGKKITFLDTPGHEAFAMMRVRGASVADIAVLVVAATEGVKTQTKEALETIKESKLPFIIALSKMDQPSANPERVKGELATLGTIVESLGGGVPSIAVSGRTGEGVPELLDMILLVAELEELKTDDEKDAEGFVLESHLDRKKGGTALLIIRDGTLRSGAFLVAAGAPAKIRMVESVEGELLETAGAGRPVLLNGLKVLPSPGSVFTTRPDKKSAEEAAEAEQTPLAEAIAAPDESAPTEDHVSIPVVLKTRVAGMLEPLERELRKAESDKVSLRFMLKEVGDLTENDIKVASAAENPLVIGFDIKVDRMASTMAERFGIEPVTFDIIYRAREYVEEEVKKRAPKEHIEELLGSAKILRVFGESKGKQIVGGTVLEGALEERVQFKIIRNNNEIGSGRIVGLQQQKLKSEKVTEGNQFGAMLDAKITVAQNDIIRAVRIA